MDKEATTSSGSLQTGCKSGDEEEVTQFLEELRQSGLATGPLPTTPEGREAALRIYWRLLSAYRSVFSSGTHRLPFPPPQAQPPAPTLAAELGKLSLSELTTALRRPKARHPGRKPKAAP